MSTKDSGADRDAVGNGVGGDADGGVGVRAGRDGVTGGCAVGDGVGAGVERVIPEGGAEHFGAEAWDKLVAFYDLLLAEGELRGLVGPREMDKLWERHILNSTAIDDFVPEGARLSDVGSGAGFPGLVMACIRPDLKVTLIESMQRRTEWLEYAAEKLGLENVRVIRSRAEDLKGKHSADVVTCRAVAALKKLVPWTLPLVKSGGSLVALKGERAGQEIDDATNELKRYRVKWAEVHQVPVWGADESTHVVELRKLG